MGSTITAAKAGNWSATDTWTGGVVPGNGDTADLNGKAVVMDIATIPAAGTLAALQSPGTAGQLTVALDAATFNSGGAINATMITAGTTTLILVSGTTAHVLTISASGSPTSISAGTAVGELAAIKHTGTGTVTVVGSVTGGSGGSAYGVWSNNAGTLNVTGTVTGGAGSLSHGLYLNWTTTTNVSGDVVGGTKTAGYCSGAGIYAIYAATVTLTNCNLINTPNALAYWGYPPVWTPAASNYHQYAAGKLALEVATAKLLKGTVNGTVTGTLRATRRIGEGGLAA